MYTKHLTPNNQRPTPYSQHPTPLAQLKPAQSNHIPQPNPATVCDRSAKKNRQTTVCICFFNSSTDRLACNHADSFFFNSCPFKSCHVTSCHLVTFHITSCHFMSLHVLSNPVAFGLVKLIEKWKHLAFHFSFANRIEKCSPRNLLWSIHFWYSIVIWRPLIFFVLLQIKTVV